MPTQSSAAQPRSRKREGRSVWCCEHSGSVRCSTARSTASTEHHTKCPRSGHPREGASPHIAVRLPPEAPCTAGLVPLSPSLQGAGSSRCGSALTRFACAAASGAAQVFCRTHSTCCRMSSPVGRSDPGERPKPPATRGQLGGHDKPCRPQKYCRLAAHSRPRVRAGSLCSDIWALHSLPLGGRHHSLERLTPSEAYV